MNATVTPQAEPLYIGVKRFNTPFSVTATCPTCGKQVTRHGDDYISYPSFNEPFDFAMYCFTEGVDDEPDIEHRFDIRATLRCTLEIISETTGAPTGGVEAS